MLSVALSSSFRLPAARRLAFPHTVSRPLRCVSRTFATHAEVCYLCTVILHCVSTITPKQDAFRIPIIDFNKYRNASTTAEKEQTAQDVVRGFTEVGFIYLSNHGIPDETVLQTFQKACIPVWLLSHPVLTPCYAQSAEFFNLPIEKKSELAWRDPRANRGFVQVGRERVTQSADAEEIKQLREKAPDYKESMEIGRDWDKTYKNYWPQESDAPGFKRTMLHFFQTCHDLHVLVMRSIALGLRLDESYFDSKIHEQYHNLRLLSYPPIKTQLLHGDGQARAGAHSDYGTLTLLFQDSVSKIAALYGSVLR